MKDDFTKEIREKIIQSLAPICYFDSKENPVHVGTSIICLYKGQMLILTAGHVADFQDKHDLYILKNGCFELQKFVTSPKNGGDRCCDPYDFAYAQCMISDLESVGFDYLLLLDKTECCSEDIKFYIAVGFPGSKTVLDHAENRMRQIPFVLISKKKICNDTHIHVDFHKSKVKYLGEDGRKTAPDPYGASGGGLFSAEIIRDSGKIRSIKFNLCGILTHWIGSNKQEIKAVRVNPILDSIDSGRTK